MSVARDRAVAVTLVDGTALVAGGYTNGTATAGAERYDPAFGIWVDAGGLNAARGELQGTLLPNARVLVAGGATGGPALATADLFDEGRGAQAAWTPAVTGPLAAVQLGASLALSGTLFRGLGEASNGWWSGSPANYPLVMLRRQDNGDTRFLDTSAWSTTAVTAAFPATLQPGPHWLRVIANGVASAALPIAVTPVIGPAAKLAFGVEPSTITSGVTISPALTVAIEDAAGNIVTTSSASVTLALGSNPNGATLSGTTTVAAVNGVAQFSDLSINRSGAAYLFVASSAGLTGASSGTFNVNPGAAAKLIFSTQPTSATAGAAIAPAVQVTVQDALGNSATGSSVNVTLAIGVNVGGGMLSGLATVPAVGGVATFSTLAIDKVGTGYTLTAASTGLAGTSSATFNITVGAPAKLGFTAQPSDTVGGAAIVPSVAVAVQDGSGNLVAASSASVTLAIAANPGGGTLLGSSTAATVNGVATFGGLSIDKLGSAYTLSASATGLQTATSAPFNVTSATATKVVFNVQPSSAIAGAVLSPSVQAQVQDASGATVIGANNTITLAIGSNPGGATLRGVASVVSVNGVADFPGLSLDKVGTGYTLTATGAGLASATSGAFDIAAGAPVKLGFAVEPSDAVAGQRVAPAVIVGVEDAYGNVVSTSTASITLTIDNNPAAATLSGTTLVSAINGQAQFSDLSLDKIGAGYTMTATSTGLMAATSSSFDIVSGAPVKLGFTVQPTSGTAGAILVPSVQVTIEDVLGSPALGADATITLALANARGATLAGTTSVSTVNGVARFAGLELDRPGTAYTLTASAPQLTGAASTPFDIVAGPTKKAGVGCSCQDSGAEPLWWGGALLGLLWGRSPRPRHRRRHLAAGGELDAAASALPRVEREDDLVEM
jgi:hypothetical protein